MRLLENPRGADRPIRICAAVRRGFRRLARRPGLLSIWSLAVLALVGCAALGGNRPAGEDPETPGPPAAPDHPGATPPVDVELQDYGPAPELTNAVWLNTDHPLRLADLRGKVVLIEMWTFG